MQLTRRWQSGSMVIAGVWRSEDAGGPAEESLDYQVYGVVFFQATGHQGLELFGVD